MKFALFVALAACGCFAVTAEFGRLFKRQADPCDISESDVPAECRTILNNTDALLSDNYTSQYCGATCGRPLYDFFRGCDEATGSTNSTKFDFSCSSNAAGDPCVFENLTFTYACAGDGELEIECSDECRDNLTMATEDIGCCAFSFFAVAAGEYEAAALFSFCNVPQSLCIGGASNETLSFPSGPVTVDPECEDLVDEVDESCRKYLNLDIYFLYGLDLEGLCDSDCGLQVYDFNVQCDYRTGAQNSTIIDLLCAINSNGTQCGDILSSIFISNPFEQCEDFDIECGTICSNAIQYIRNQGGCCFDTALAIESGILGLNQLYSLCGLEPSETCIGAFSDERITPQSGGDRSCEDLLDDLPVQCRDYTSADLLLSHAYTDPVTFTRNFCNGDCSEAIYKYFVECDKITSNNNAANVDFLCTNNTNNDPCIGIYTDQTLFNVFEDSCYDTSPTSCSDTCSSALVERFDYWGCCLFTFTALQDNVTFVEAIIEECKLETDTTKLCIGGLSGKPIAAEEGDDIEDAAVSIIISSTVLMMAALIMTLTM